MRALWAGAGLSAMLFAGCNGIGDPVCTLAGCNSTMTVDIGPIADPARYAGSTVTLCVTSICSTVTLPDAVPDPGTSVDMETASDPRLSASFGNFGGDYSLHVSLADGRNDMLDDGDEYTLEIRDVDNVVIQQHAWSADYTVSIPNGEPCPPRCLSQVLELPAA